MHKCRNSMPKIKHMFRVQHSIELIGAMNLNTFSAGLPARQS